MMSHFELLPNDDNTHALLEPPTPAYTSVTVRRAFIVWLHCGQRNEFRNVCNYFHYLETLEDKLSPEARASSRHLEFNLLSTQPPFSYYMSKHFPKLYRQDKHNKVNIKQIEEIRLEDCVFNLEGFHDLKIQKGVTTKEIIRTSQMIRKYCKSHSKSLKRLLQEFQDFTKKTEAKNSVNNISVYIKKKYLKDELVTYKNMPKHFSFLDAVDDTRSQNITCTKTGKALETNKSLSAHVDCTANINKNASKIRILINEARRKELMSLLPHLSDLSLKDCENNKFSNQIISSKVIEMHKKKTEDEFGFANKI